MQLATSATAKVAQPGLKKDEILILFLYCPQSLCENFEHSIENLVRKQLALGKQSRILQNLREALLPKLISGELRVSERL